MKKPIIDIINLMRLIEEAHRDKKMVMYDPAIDRYWVTLKRFEGDKLVADYTPDITDELFGDLPSLLTDNDIASAIANHYSREGIEVEIPNWSARKAEKIKNMDKAEKSEMIRTRRLQTGLPRTEVAKRLGIPYKTFENYESGKRTPNDFVFNTIIEKLDAIIYSKNMSE